MFEEYGKNALPLDACLLTVQKLFLSCTNLKFVDWEEVIKHIREHSDPVAAQFQLLKATVNHPLNLLQPVKEDYHRLFLKRFISQLESCGEEVSESLYKVYIEKLQNCSSSDTQTYHFRHFRLDHQAFVTLRESTSIVSRGTTGLVTWEGGLALAEWCVQQRSLVSQCCVLELGCGQGLLGLSVCGLCRPRSYTLTDCHPGVLSALHHNLSLNPHLLSNISVRLLDWQDPGNRDLGVDVDLVLAADVVYDESLFPSLVDTLYHFLGHKPTRAVLACTERNPHTLSAFLLCLAQKGLQVEELRCPPPRTFHYSVSPPIRLFSCTHGSISRSFRCVFPNTNEYRWYT